MFNTMRLISTILQHLL